MKDIFFGCSKQIIRYGFLRRDVNHMKKLIESLSKSRVIIFNKDTPSRHGLEVLFNNNSKKLTILEIERHPLIKDIIHKWLSFNIEMEKHVSNKTILPWNEIDDDIKKVSVFWMGFDDMKVLSDSEGTSFYSIDIGDSTILKEYINSKFVENGENKYSNGMFDAISFNNTESTAYAYAKMFLDFTQKNNFCPSCGGHVVATDLGSRLYCLNDSPYNDHQCKVNNTSNNLQFPRTDPVIIIALYDDNGRILLGSNTKRHPPKLTKIINPETKIEEIHSTTMYTCFAGFMEPGETIEHACIREVYEETGLHVSEHDIRIVESQPWPFPANLMIGCIGMIKGRQRDESQINIDHDKELDDVRWFSGEEVLTVLDGGTSYSTLPNSKPENSIARWNAPPAESVAGRILRKAVDLHGKELVL